MTWGKVDDKLHSATKWRGASKSARGLWTTCLSWCMDQLTDGMVPAAMLPVLDGTRADAASLVKAGLWEEVEGGWLFHDWLDYQPSRESVLADRKASAERQKRAREKAKASRDSHAVTAPVSHAVTAPVSHAIVTPRVTVPPTRPDPTRPVVGLLRVVGDVEEISSSSPKRRAGGDR